ncbi:MAG: group III truncated hemoglobin [Bacteroidetes bacterium]|nr:MAG: group III truncated hemoglobin [Bacteroidota bacterium]
MKHDISNTDDVKLLVDTFYTAIRQDALLAPVFAQRIADDKWPIHLEKMYRFWGTLLLQTQNYNGSPFDKHIGLGIDSTHFNQWVTLFGETVDSLFEGEVATLAKERANNIGLIFSHKLESMK